MTVDRPHDENYKMFKFKNTYTQDNRQLFQIIGQIHDKMLLNIDLFTLSCGLQALADETSTRSRL